jgi:4-hydroxythreonine-4-phosphate dehydrogenase
MPIAVTMGDGAGIGPEIVVAALSETDHDTVVIGDRVRLEQAADILGKPPPENVVDLALLPPDLPWGEVSPIAGEAAYRYIERAAELALAGEVDAICTAPVNKAALHAAGHRFPGHTELLAHLTGTEEVSMLLSTPKVKARSS